MPLIFVLMRLYLHYDKMISMHFAPIHSSYTNSDYSRLFSQLASFPP